MIPANATVRHAVFGVGLVLASTEQRITVQFDDGSTRTLVPALARLERVSASERPRTTQSATPRARKAPAAQKTPGRANPRGTWARDVTYSHHCAICNRDWQGRTPDPYRCPHCCSTRWRKAALPAVHCERCGHDWTPHRADPVSCPECNSHNWRRELNVERHCHRCGLDWRPRVPEPNACPRCFSKHWNDANYVMAECLRLRGERKRAKRAMREVAA